MSGSSSRWLLTVWVNEEKSVLSSVAWGMRMHVSVMLLVSFLVSFSSRYFLDDDKYNTKYNTAHQQHRVKRKTAAAEGARVTRSTCDECVVAVKFLTQHSLTHTHTQWREGEIKKRREARKKRQIKLNHCQWLSVSKLKCFLFFFSSSRHTLCVSTALIHDASSTTLNRTLDASVFSPQLQMTWFNLRHFCFIIRSDGGCICRSKHESKNGTLCDSKAVTLFKNWDSWRLIQMNTSLNENIENKHRIKPIWAIRDTLVLSWYSVDSLTDFTIGSFWGCRWNEIRSGANTNQGDNSLFLVLKEFLNSRVKMIGRWLSNIEVFG